MTNRDWKSLGETTVGIDGTQGEVFEAGYLRAIVSQDGPDAYWHLSVSHYSGVYPNWDQLADARYDLVPLDVDMALILPPPEDYTNYHEGVLQLTEIRDPAMPIDRGGGDRRTRLSMGGSLGVDDEV